MTTETQTSPTPITTISVTPKAAEKLRMFAGKQGFGDQFAVRVAVKGGGCSGLTYTLDIVKGADTDDKVIDQHGVMVCVPKKAYVFIAGMTLDFSDGLNGKGFTFSNPNAKKTCGCGTSFGV